jgi:membrane-bound metal-dependent hydrolase YbcI (DUF457 family)
MPVLGHAFVGLAIGLSTRPDVHDERRASRVEAGSALWVPAAVTLSYLPDVVSHVALLAGWSDGRLLGHSVFFAVAASLPMAALLMRLAAVSFARALSCALVSVLMHDVLDLAQATDGAPWWPLSARRVGSDLALLPTGLLQETAVFGALLVAFVALLHVTGRLVPERTDGSSRSRGQRRRVWLGHAFVVVVIVIAAVTHGLRDRRESDLETGRALIEQQAYQPGLRALAQAERWPSTAKPGRIDYLRAEAYVGTGDRRHAEAYYLRAYRADPTYFWPIADLALFYASSHEPVAERRRLTAPYLSRLRADFAGHEALPRVIASVERELAKSQPQP